MFDAGPLYIENCNASEKFLINQGGTSSGKTYSIMQVLFFWAIKNKRYVITVVGESIPNLKKGAYRDAETIYDLTPELSYYVTSWNKSDRIIYFKNGSIIEFTSFESEQSAKNGKRDVAFFNEANGLTYQIYWQVARRTRHKVLLDYNPSAEFWAHEKLIGKPNTRLIISDHRHNLWLSEEQHQEIENIKYEDEELHKVYARGKTGKIEGLIFKKWSVCESIPEAAKHLGAGLDFGFTNDVTAVVDVYMLNGELWINELIYETGLTNAPIQGANHKLPNISDRLIEIGYPKIRAAIIADSAEQKSIAELKSVGWRIEPANKGADSIINGLDILKRYHINVTRQSTNLRKELNSYKWKVDKLTGLPLNEPIDKFNHAIDAMRYVALNMLSNKPTKRPTKAAGFF
jgi:phage terminase large subunit